MRSANQSPQSVGSSGMDSGVDSFSDQSGELPSVAMSLCGGLTENRDITQGKKFFCTVYSIFGLLTSIKLRNKSLHFLSTEEFEEKAVSYQEFANNPSIIDDPNLVVKIGTKYVEYSTKYFFLK